MARRGDRIHKRKDGRWEGRYPLGRNQNGTLLYGSVYGKTYLEVKDKLLNIPNAMETFQKRNSSKITFEDVLAQWMDNNRVHLKGGTIYKYQNIIDTHIMPELGGIKMTEINATLINDFLARKLKNGRLDGAGGLSQSYVRSITLVITATIKYAVSEGFCQPLKTPIYKPVAGRNKLSILSLEEQKAFEAFLNSNLNEKNVGILLSLYTGLRIGEVCALAWEDIDMKQRVIHVRHTIARIKDEDNVSGRKTKLILDTPKTKASLRDIPISSQLMPILSRLRAVSTSVYVISKGKTFLSPRTFEHHFHRMLMCGNITYVNYHCLRHTFATRCIEAGVDVKSLSEILGHANVGITLNTYVHSSIELKRTQLEKLTTL